MNQKDIVASLTYGFSEIYTKNVDWGNPDKFDAEADDLDSWVHVSIPSITMERRRVGKPRRGTFRMQVIIAARTQDDLYACDKLAGEITELLEHWQPVIKDYSTSAETPVGYAMLHEAQMMEDESDKDTWQRRRIEIEGHFHEVA